MREKILLTLPRVSIFRVIDRKKFLFRCISCTCIYVVLYRTQEETNTVERELSEVIVQTIGLEAANLELCHKPIGNYKWLDYKYLL